MACAALIIGKRFTKRSITMSKIKINSESLNRVINILGAAIPSNIITPSDGVFKFVIEGDKCHISAANAKCEITSFIKCESDEDIEFCVPHYVTSNTVKNFPEGDMQIDTEFNDELQYVTSIKIKPPGSRKKYKIACEGNPERFPHWPEIEEEVLEEFVYKMGSFSEMIRALAQNVDSQDPTNYYRDISFVTNEGKLKMISGNSQTAASFDTDIDFSSNYIVPHEVAKYVAQLGEGDSKITITKSRISMESSGTKIKAKMVDMKPAGFMKIYKTEPEKKVIVSRDEMLKTLRRLSAFADEGNRVYMTCEGEALTLKAHNKAGHEAEEDIEIVNQDGMRFELIMNYAFLNRSISIMKSENIMIKYNGESPISFLRPDDPSNRQVWMLARYGS